jgi:MFS family permease
MATTQTFAFQSRRLTPAQRNAFISALVGWIFDYYEVSLLTLLAVPISRELKLGTGEVANLLSVQLLFLAVGGVGFGLLSDRFGRRVILMATVLTYALATLARAFAPDYGWLLALTAVAALGIGGEYGVGQALVSEVVHPRARGWWSGLLYGGIFVGIMLAAVVGGNLAPRIGWRWTFAISSLPVLVAVFIRFTTPESDVWVTRVKRHGVRWQGLLSRAFLAPFGLCLVAAILQFFAYYGITTFLPTYLVKTAHFSMGKASWWIFFSGVAGIVGCVIGAYMSDRWGRRVTLSTLAASAFVGGLVLFLTFHFLLSSPLILIPFFVLYLGSNGATVFGALFSELFPTDLRTTGVSASLQIGRGLAFIPPLITAAIYPIYGYAPVVLIGAGEFLLLAIWAWVFKETRGIDIIDVDRQFGAVSAEGG